jgi:hypothetical protein
MVFFAKPIDKDDEEHFQGGMSSILPFRRLIQEQQLDA